MMTVVDRFGLGRIFVESATIVSYTQTSQWKRTVEKSQSATTVKTHRLHIGKCPVEKSATIVSREPTDSSSCNQIQSGISHAHHPKDEKKNYEQMMKKIAIVQGHV